MMRRWIALLGSLAVLTPALASPPVPGGIPIPAMPAMMPQGSPYHSATGTTATVIVPHLPAPHAPAVPVPPLPSALNVPPCPGGCPTAGDTKRVCVGKMETKKETHPVYATKEVEFCQPRSCLHAILNGGDCAANCKGEPRVKAQLVKKIVTEEKSVCKCAPTTVREQPKPAPAPKPAPCPSPAPCATPCPAPCASPYPLVKPVVGTGTPYTLVTPYVMPGRPVPAVVQPQPPAPVTQPLPQGPSVTPPLPQPAEESGPYRGIPLPPIK